MALDRASGVHPKVDRSAKFLLPVHWATFNLSYHAWSEPIERSLAAARDKGVVLVTPRVGEVVDNDVPFESRDWYLGTP